MRILEERKDYTLYYLTYDAFNMWKNSTNQILQVCLDDKISILMEQCELKELEKDLKRLSKSIVKRWKNENKN